MEKWKKLPKLAKWYIGLLLYYALLFFGLALFFDDINGPHRGFAHASRESLELFLTAGAWVVGFAAFIGALSFIAKLFLSIHSWGAASPESVKDARQAALAIMLALLVVAPFPALWGILMWLEFGLPFF